mmetsp:Transcript_47656/g.110412  ORF Transcript_47656/g.110412 Transcript_47656/m.110412 type:complete len:229 (+) Transcript_47656:19-705(+)
MGAVVWLCGLANIQSAVHADSNAIVLIRAIPAVPIGRAHFVAVVSQLQDETLELGIVRPNQARALKLQVPRCEILGLQEPVHNREIGALGVNDHHGHIGNRGVSFRQHRRRREAGDLNLLNVGRAVWRFGKDLPLVLQSTLQRRGPRETLERAEGKLGLGAHPRAVDSEGHTEVPLGPFREAEHVDLGRTANAGHHGMDNLHLAAAEPQEGDVLLHLAAEDLVGLHKD